LSYKHNIGNLNLDRELKIRLLIDIGRWNPDIFSKQQQH
jgi:hypothetical protein